MKKNKPKKLPPKLQVWVDARKRHGLSHAQVQMARELGMNPKKLGKIDNHDQEQWKLPLPQFIERLYKQHHVRDLPLVVLSMEEKHRRDQPRRSPSVQPRRSGDNARR